MTFRTFRHKGTNLRINSEAYGRVSSEIIRLREELESFFVDCPDFAEALSPLNNLTGDVPESVVLMLSASQITGTVGPMAAVAGTMAQLAGQAAKNAGVIDVLVDNGGDLYLDLSQSITLGVFAGNHPLSGKIALEIEPEMTPCGLCASSGKMGHSFSEGKCDLALVYGDSGSIADAVATYAANLVTRREELEKAAEKAVSVSGIRGVILLADGMTAMAGSLPSIVPCRDMNIPEKVTRDHHSFFPYL